MVTEAEKNRFLEISHLVEASVHERSGIGTYKEKMIHLVLKKYFCGDESCHEVKMGRFVADAAEGEYIYEIQSMGLHPLKKKLPSYVEETDKKIVVILPVISKKSLVWVEPESGEMTAPKRVSVARPKNRLLREFVYIGDLVDFSRMEFKVVFIDADEYRLLDGFGADKKRKATKVDRIPRELIDIVTINSKEAFGNFFMPGDMPYEFRAKDFERASGLRKKGVSAGLRALELVGIIEREKLGEHKVVYRVII